MLGFKNIYMKIQSFIQGDITMYLIKDDITFT
jgi:hypothetical protein